MRFRPWLVAWTSVAAGVLAVAACTTDYQQGKGDPSFGGPNALAGQRPPGPTIDNQDGGAASGAPGAKPKCGTPVDGGTCAVSFAKDVLAEFGNAGCAAVGCHGGVVPFNLPRVEPSEPPAMWQEFQAFTMSDGKPYIDPCTQDDKKMGMACNLYAPGQAGACGVHMPSTGQLAPAAITKIETWLKCGAPNN